MSRTLTVTSADGTTIGCRRVGSGPPVVALHGGLGTARSWALVAGALADRFEFFLVDRRGRGASGAGEGVHSMAREVEDTRAVLRATGPGAVLLGHSYGGAVALMTALAAAPGDVSALAVYEPGIGIAGQISGAEIERIDDLITREEPESALELGLALLDASGLVATKPLPPRAHRPAALVSLAWTVGRELRAVNALGADLTRYAAITIPVLVLIGTASRPAMRGASERLAETLPDAQVAWLEGLGHVAHTGAPDVVVGALAPFLSAHARAETHVHESVTPDQM